MEDNKEMQVPPSEEAANEKENIKENPSPSSAENGEQVAKDGKEDRQKSDKKLKREAEILKAELAGEIKKTAEAKKKLEESESKYLHMLAEYDNFRRRTMKERDGIYSDAVSDVVKEILPIIDNIERASLYSDAEKVAEGLVLTAKSISSMLTKLGISEIGKAGEKFDPNLHNAVMHVEDENLGENEIVDVLQKGYAIGDRVIRYAMVKVAN